jgi:hypothetical protein
MLQPTVIGFQLCPRTYAEFRIAILRGGAPEVNQNRRERTRDFSLGHCDVLILIGGPGVCDSATASKMIP